MKRILPFLLILAVAGLAFGVGAALYRSKLEPAATFAPIPGESAETPSGAVPPHYKGAPGAPVVLEEFADLQCPPCAMLAVLLKKLEQDYPGKVRIVFRNFPLAMHKNAVPAARAAESAGAQGKFWEMSDLLYQNQTSWAKEEAVAPIFEEYAQKIGLDLARYKTDLENNDLLGRIGLDRQRGTTLGVTATPTLFINNQRVPQQSMNEAGLRSAIDNVVKGQPPFPAITASPSPTP